MATHRIPIISANFAPESGVFWDIVNNQVSFTNQMGNQGCIVIPAPSGADVGFYDSFETPQNYVGSGKIIAKGVLDGAMTSVTLGTGIRGLSLADNEAADAAYTTEDLGNTNTNRADKDVVQVDITLSNLALTAGEMVGYYWYREDGADDYTGNLLLMHLLLEYSDA